MRLDDDTSEFSDDELFRLEGDDVADLELAEDEAVEVDELLDDVLREDERVVSEDEERVLRYAVGDDKISKASELRMRSRDIDEGQLEIPKPEVLDVEDDWREGLDERPVNRVFVLGGAVMLAILALGVVWAAIELRHGDEVADTSEKKIVERAEIDAQSEVDAKDMIGAIDEVCRNYIAASTVEEKLKYVASKEEVLPMMKDYYSRYELTSKELVSAEVRLSSDTNYRIYWVVDCKIKGEEMPKRLVVAQRDQRVFEVLWELDVAYQPMSVSEYMEKRPSEVVPFRCIVQAKAKSGFYGYSFSDYGKYRCFQIRFPKSEQFMWGYTEIGSEVDKQLYDAYKSAASKGASGKGYPMIVGLRFMPKDGSDKSVLIDQFIKDDWKVH